MLRSEVLMTLTRHSTCILTRLMRAIIEPQISRSIHKSYSSGEDNHAKSMPSIWHRCDHFIMFDIAGCWTSRSLCSGSRWIWPPCKFVLSLHVITVCHMWHHVILYHTPSLLSISTCSWRNREMMWWEQSNKLPEITLAMRSGGCISILKYPGSVYQTSASLLHQRQKLYHSRLNTPTVHYCKVDCNVVVVRYVVQGVFLMVLLMFTDIRLDSMHLIRVYMFSWLGWLRLDTSAFKDQSTAHQIFYATLSQAMRCCTGSSCSITAQTAPATSHRQLWEVLWLHYTGNPCSIIVQCFLKHSWWMSKEVQYCRNHFRILLF